MGYPYAAAPSSSYLLNVAGGIATDTMYVAGGIATDTMYAADKITSKGFYLSSYATLNYLLTTNGSCMSVSTDSTAYSKCIQIGNMVWIYINYSNFGNSSYYVIPPDISAPTSEVRVFGYVAGRGNWDKFRIGTFRISSGSRYLTYVEGDTGVSICSTICYYV